MIIRNSKGQFVKGNHSGSQFKKGNKPMAGFKKGHKFGNRFKKGYKFSKEIETKRRASLMGRKRPDMSAKINDKNSGWKGDNVGYVGLHLWVKRHLGQPKKCEHCGKNGLIGKQIHWANIDHKYKRNLNDWIRLCASCHQKYDIKYNNYKKIWR